MTISRLNRKTYIRKEAEVIAYRVYFLGTLERCAFLAVILMIVSLSAPATNPSPIYNLKGFAAQPIYPGVPSNDDSPDTTTGGGVIPETDPAYRQVSTPLELAQAVGAANKAQGVKVIEIMNDLDLGWNEISEEAKTTANSPFVEAAVPKLHPKLLTSGVSVMIINPRNGGLTIFSANGAAIRHCTWSIKATTNIIIRNLKFDELWEWDEESKGDYDKNNWDFIDLGVGGGTVDHVWIDHCTFTNAYDGIADNKGGVSNVTYSWCKYEGDDGATNPNSFVRQQINALEANMSAYPMYNFLRTHGFSTEDIVQISQGSKKGTAIGELSLNPVNVNASVTFHHQWYINPWDRLPRLAGGQAHNYNIYVDCTKVLAARRLRDSIAAAMSPADQDTLNNTYNFKPPINGSISTEDGALFVEKSVYIDCVYPLRNNQTDPSNPIYTGKIKAEDTIYVFHETDGSTTYVRGDSTEPGNPLGPFQAPIKPFSWNTSDGERPYPAPPMHDPNDLETIITDPAAGAGAGVIMWEKSNWLKTSYENLNLPTVDAGADQVTWLGNSGTAGQEIVYLDGTTSDDGPYTVLWTQVDNGAPTVTIDPADQNDTTVTITEGGMYEFRLMADDGSGQSFDSVEIIIGEDGCDASHLSTGDAYSVGDFNLDCRVDIDDFALLAMKWLNCTNTLQSCY
jgi:pectate lyase